MGATESVVDSLDRLPHPDKILFTLPVLFLGVYALTILFVDAHVLSLGLAGLFSSPLVADALFLRPPTRRQ